MSQDRLAVGALSAAPGEKTYGVETVVAGGQQVPLASFLINGDRPGPTLVVTAGVHAAEYASIAAALDFGAIAAAPGPGRAGDRPARDERARLRRPIDLHLPARRQRT